MAVSVAVIGGVALPSVMWRDASGHRIPKQIVILIPILAGALCFGLGSVLLNIFGLRVSAKPPSRARDSGEL